MKRVKSEHGIRTFKTLVLSIYNFVLVFFVENFSLESIVLKYNDVNIYCAVLQNGKYEKSTILLSYLKVILFFPVSLKVICIYIKQRNI